MKINKIKYNNKKSTLKILEKMDNNFNDVLLKLVNDRLLNKNENIIKCKIKKVLNNGMTRKLSFNLLDSSITENLSFFYGARYNKKLDTFNVNGCGMDMIFHCLNNFSYCFLNMLEPNQKNQIEKILNDNNKRPYELFTNYRLID